MFTVKIIKNNETSVCEAQQVSIYNKGSDGFASWASYHGADVDNEDLVGLLALDGDNIIYLYKDASAYIVNAQGKTVATF
jgi:hypothetical protein